MSSKVAVYLRVSTLDQETGIQSQEKAIADYLAGHGITDAIYFRDRISGKDLDRPAFKALQKAIFNGAIKTVVTYKLDRLSRSVKDGITLLCDWLERDIRVIAIAQQLDFSGPVGKLIASVLFAVAEIERNNISESVKRGMAAYKAKGGVFKGRQPKLHATDIQALLDQGKSMSEAARILKANRSALYKALARAKQPAMA